MSFLYVWLGILVLVSVLLIILMYITHRRFQERLDFEICAFLAACGTDGWVEMEVLKSVVMKGPPACTLEEFEVGFHRMEEEGYVERREIDGVMHARNCGR
jgi:hypothetical protein